MCKRIIATTPMIKSTVRDGFEDAQKEKKKKKF